MTYTIIPFIIFGIMSMSLYILDAFGGGLVTLSRYMRDRSNKFAEAFARS